MESLRNAAGTDIYLIIIYFDNYFRGDESLTELESGN